MLIIVDYTRLIEKALDVVGKKLHVVMWSDDDDDDNDDDVEV